MNVKTYILSKWIIALLILLLVGVSAQTWVVCSHLDDWGNYQHTYNQRTLEILGQKADNETLGEAVQKLDNVWVLLDTVRQEARERTGETTPVLDAREQYARGMYDVCMEIMQDRGTCNQGVGLRMANGWYEQASPGFQFPVVVDGQAY